MDLKSRLRKLAFACDMDYFGVGPVERWAQAPAGHRPNDFLPGVKSVIVMGIRIPAGAIAANDRAYRGLRHGIFSYMIFGYNKLNELLDTAALEMARRLGEASHETYLLPSSIPRDEYLMMGEMSNRHSAVCAGLADFGWNGLALTPEAGPRVRWVPLLTTAELEPDPLYSGPRLCDRSKCRVCIDVCPVHALSEEESVEVRIAERSYSYSRLNRPLCRCGVTGLARGTAGRLQAEIPPVRTVEEWLEIARKDSEWNRMERVASMCGRCLAACPVGRTK